MEKIVKQQKLEAISQKIFQKVGWKRVMHRIICHALCFIEITWLHIEVSSAHHRIKSTSGCVIVYKIGAG